MRDLSATSINLDSNTLNDTSSQPWIVVAPYFSQPRSTRIGVTSRASRKLSLFRNAIHESCIELFHDGTNRSYTPSIVESATAGSSTLAWPPDHSQVTNQCIFKAPAPVPIDRSSY